MEFENPTEENLFKSQALPVEIKGVFEIIDGGDSDTESGYTSWLSGTLLVSNCEDDLGIMIEEPALVRAKLSEDSLEGCEHIFVLYKAEVINNLICFYVQDIKPI